MNEDAKKFRSKYFYAPRRTTLPEDFDKSVENLANMKSSLEEAAEYKVLGKEKTVQEITIQTKHKKNNLHIKIKPIDYFLSVFLIVSRI